MHTNKAPRFRIILEERIREGKRKYAPFKQNRKLLSGTSGNAVVVSKRGILKTFVEGNVVWPKQVGRGRGTPITNHQAIDYYCNLLHERRWINSRELREYSTKSLETLRQSRRIYGHPKTSFFSVRPVKLIREGPNYHLVENVAGPNLEHFLAFVKGIKLPRPARVTNPEQAKVLMGQRKLLSDFVRKNKKQIEAWKSQRKEFEEEFRGQINWVENNAEADLINLYPVNLKPSDFVVEGIEGNKLKLVMVDHE